MNATDPAAAPRCQSCPALVFWAWTVNGKRMLVDAEPVRGGNLRIEQRDHREPLALVVSRHLAFGQQLYQSHFASCRAATAHRRKRSTS